MFGRLSAIISAVSILLASGSSALGQRDMDQIYLSKGAPARGSIPPDGMSRNPRTGATIKIKAAKVPKFRPGKALKDAVN